MDTEYTILPEWEAIERFEADLDDAYDLVDICGTKYSPSGCLKLIDPVAYRCAFIDFLDDECIKIEGEE